MSEDKQLLSRIADLAGQINHHKVRLPLMSDSTGTIHHSSSRLDHESPKSAYPWLVSRGHQQFQSRGRINKFGSRPQRHRSLVLNKPMPLANSPMDSYLPLPNMENDLPLDEGETVESQPRATATWISKRDRHMQLINSSVYDKEKNLRQQAIEKTRQEKALRKNQREMHKIGKHFQRIADNTLPTAIQHSERGNTAVYEVNVNGLRFQVLNGGSKLMRDLGATGLAGLTPKQAVVGGVTFFRSKNGNLYRAGLVRAKRRSGTTQKVDAPKVLFAPILTTQEESRFVLRSSKVESALQDNAAIFHMIPPLNEFPLVYISYVRFVDEAQSDVSSEEEDLDEIDSDDVDSEGLDEDMILPPNHQSTVSLTQQHDFVGF
ncbi:hypothetical protein MMC11_008252 [Xylographa trunciseda]|nr:hypothetical protein [Xylographa trunciseda]